ncbi:hypothetical protein SEUCBS140593_003387 [Sporothrix eucalyptigena]|uniref:Uncharacterized protein n=1 Tax=Sporothrix eucalyptigena TaxID=1812306 RepID=A0ABP0BEP3_9PEZI
MNTNDVFSNLHNLDLDVPPDLDLNEIPMLARMASTTTTKEFTFPWNMNLNMLPAADHFTLLQTTANQLLADHAGTIQSLGSTIKPHLRGPMTPILIILVSIMVSVLVSAIISIIQMAVLAAAVVYFFPSVLAAIPSSTATMGSSGKTGNKQVSRTPMAAFAGVLAASYAFSSIAAIVVLASSAYAYLNQAAVASAKKKTLAKPDTRNHWQGEPEQTNSSMFRRISRHRDSF